jgi:hypothetical protein
MIAEPQEQRAPGRFERRNLNVGEREGNRKERLASLLL